MTCSCFVLNIFHIFEYTSLHWISLLPCKLQKAGMSICFIAVMQQAEVAS